MELGQLCFAENTQEFEVPSWVRSMLRGVYNNIARVYWNVHKEQFESYGQYANPNFGAVSWRHYDPDSDKPNLWHAGMDQRISWYKNFGRSMTCAVQYTPQEWIAWHDAVMAELDRCEKECGDGRARRYLSEG